MCTAHGDFDFAFSFAQLHQSFTFHLVSDRMNQAGWGARSFGAWTLDTTGSPVTVKMLLYLQPWPRQLLQRLLWLCKRQAECCSGTGEWLMGYGSFARGSGLWWFYLSVDPRAYCTIIYIAAFHQKVWVPTQCTILNTGVFSTILISYLFPYYIV